MFLFLSRLRHNRQLGRRVRASNTDRACGNLAGLPPRARGLLHVISFDYTLGAQLVTRPHGAASPSKHPSRADAIPQGARLAPAVQFAVCAQPPSLKNYSRQAFDIRNLRGMQYFVMLGASTGLTASLLVSLAALSRLFFFMANDGLLPPVFTSYRQTKGTTPAATFLATLLTSVIAVSVQSTTLLMWMGMGSLLAYTSVALSVLSLRYGLVERLPFESEEIFSRDSTCSDLRACNSSVHPVVTRSVSDCYLNKSLNECTGCDFFADSRQRPSAEEMAVNPNYIASSHKAPSRGNALRMSQGNQDYGSLTTRTMAVEFVNHSYVTSISSYAFPNPKRLPTPATARRVTGKCNNDARQAVRRYSKTWSFFALPAIF